MFWKPIYIIIESTNFGIVQKTLMRVLMIVGFHVDHTVLSSLQNGNRLNLNNEYVNETL